jgi:hypothetical protein
VSTDQIVYNPKVARTCPRCHKYNTQFTEGGRIEVVVDQKSDPPEISVIENPSAVRNIVCAACGHRWYGRLTRSERGIA